MRRVRISLAWILPVFLIFLLPGLSDSMDFPEIQKLVGSFKNDQRGPYQGIRWFYPDGTILPARSPSPDKKGGLQHALLKDVVVQIQKEHGIYLGQILAGMNFEDFLDESHQYSRMKQYQMEQYLRAVDNGWVFRRAQYYRGAVQVEDEERWGERFLAWLLSKDEMVASRFFLCRQVSQDVPHKVSDSQVTRVRALAKNIANEMPSFMDIRIKIHGKPDAQDLVLVRDFRKKYENQLSTEVDKQLQELEQKLESIYQKPVIRTLTPYVQKMPDNLSVQLKWLLDNESKADTRAKCKAIADLLWNIRAEIPSLKSGKSRLTLMDLSIELEHILTRMIGGWKPETIGELLEKNYSFAKATAGCGLIESWEWETAEIPLSPPQQGTEISLEDFIAKVDGSRRAVYWGTGMVRVSYESIMDLFSRFEPLASGFAEERIRNSILLAFGDTVAELSDLATHFSGLSNRVFNIKNQGEINGLNPGFALGELEVIPGSPDNVSFSAKKIYILQRAPADLKPVAGIATVSEGNMVSHVQLLARNLGIPNAVLSIGSLNEMVPFSGKTVFYAVSPRGKVVMKLASDMTSQEEALVEERKRKEERIRVPTDRIQLKRVELLSLLELSSADSGRICGPKAANLGQLRSLFPDKVAPGFVIPFGVFRKSMDLPMPGTDGSLWKFLQETFAQAARERESGKGEEEVEAKILLRLSQLQDAIKSTPLSPEFVESLRVRFREVLGGEMGQVPVFIRSDTNMEDLKEFTGAGLNLTVPNVVKEKDILQGIRDVWASPFRERGYRWRQKYLLNPENVYPSILLLKSVNVEKSGVMITTGIVSSEPRDVTVAFNWGVGGAVDGQVAETYLLRYDGSDTLLSPAREPSYRYLPSQGGIEKGVAYFEKPILSKAERDQLRKLAQEIRERLPGTPGIESTGPFDVELGFLNGAVWLFQVRPFVESRNARSTMYLREMDPDLPRNARVSLMGKIVK